MADDKFVSGVRVLSMSQTRDATDTPRAVAICFNVSMNSGSSVILV